MCLSAVPGSYPCWPRVLDGLERMAPVWILAVQARCILERRSCVFDTTESAPDAGLNKTSFSTCFDFAKICFGVIVLLVFCLAIF